MQAGFGLEEGKMVPVAADPVMNVMMRGAVAVEAGGLVEIVPIQNPAQYPRQKIMDAEIASYAFPITVR